MPIPSGADAEAPRLSVLDVVPVFSGSDTAQALCNTVDLAPRVEALGYLRYWVAEHHNIPSLATSSPAVLAGQLASVTTRLRVGSGGVLLPNHAPLVVAEQFGTLEALYPGRIDLGIGRASGGDPLTARALGRPFAPDDFPRQLRELTGYLAGTADTASERSVAAIPAPPGQPWLCILGSSLASARFAGVNGLPYAFAHHLVPHLTVAALDTYRSAFRASSHLDEPYAVVAAAVVAGESDEHARELALPYLLRKIHIQRGLVYGLYPNPAEVAAHSFSRLEEKYLEEHSADQFFGGPATLAEKVAELVRRSGADELMALSLIHDHADRVRSYELLAGAVPAAHRSSPHQIPASEN
ncbi:alkanal monooxygenase [Parafrankia colletiae]|uniref:Alkanal monooxygenase n=1 Tax=Parafrankia colletiae TaxID=573497 RepID=A0A1S1R4U3_9ACTN|nr:LLM class flavin-dependent oxidoreductase [Parafrankia colletiae]MCK9900264.1 LLM class flavin-dependent oxidoreductase [Frankia sp. Cpl3]OHV40302.1 alkanal monooxygenase [Parafrankia colletiae]